MPYKRTSKRTYKRKPRPYKRTKPLASKATYRKENRGLNQGLGRLTVRADPFPATKYCRLTFSDTYILASGTAGVIGTEQVFRLNSIYDPDYTGVGRQPYGHDQLAALYANYKVNGIHIDVTLTDPSLDGLGFIMQVVPPNASASTGSLSGRNLGEASEGPMTVVRHMNDSGKQVVKFRQYLPMSRVFGITPLQFKASAGAPYSAVFGTNPADSAYLRTAVGSVRGSGGETIVMNMRLTYYVQCYERIRVGTS